MLKNHLKIAWRNLIKNKGYSLINIGGLALGMAVTLVIALWMHDELTYNDYFKDGSRIAQVYQSVTANGETGTSNPIPLPLEKAFRDGYNDSFEHIVMASWLGEQYLKYGDKSISRSGNFMQPGAVDLLELKMVKGDKNALEDINSIIISVSTANALFGNENPIGKVINVNQKSEMMVRGVYEDLPYKNSFKDLDFLMPWKKFKALYPWMERNMDNWTNNSFQMYVKIAENADMAMVSESIRNVKYDLAEGTKEYNPQLMLLPMKDWHLRANFENGKQSGGRIKIVQLFGIIALLVLVLACINFMNLSTARSEKRAKEVGIRKAIGSKRSQVISQFLGESFLVVIFAYILSIGFVLLSLKAFNELAQKEMIFPFGNIWFWIASLVFIIFTSFLAGSYPALYLSSFRPVQVLKGTFVSTKGTVMPRKLLVVVQFTVSVVFIIGTIIVMQQVQFAQNRPVGYNKEGLIQLPVMSKEFLGKSDLMREEFIASGAVIEMATSSAPTTAVWSSWSGFSWKGKPENFQESFNVMHVSPEYTKTLGLNVIEGRGFSREFTTDSSAVLLNRAAVEYMRLTNPVGMVLTDPDKENPRKPLKVVGVVDDVITSSPYESVKQMLYMFENGRSVNLYNLRLDPKRNTAESLKIVESVFKKHFPDTPFKYDFVDEEYSKKFASEQRIGTLAGVFSILAVLISCLGLFGLTSFVAEQRTKEIGVRKVLGATIFNVWNMLSKDFLKLVVISCLIAIPIAYYIMNNWLQDYSYRITLKWWVFALAVIGSMLLTIITVSFQAIRAARSNPVKSLRTE